MKHPSPPGISCLRCAFCILLAMLPSWLIINIIIVYMSENHLFPCWRCVP